MLKRSVWMKQSRQENLIYLALWGLLFASPLLSLYVRTISDADMTFDWTEVFIVWQKFTIYLVLFLIHNFLLAPLLVHGRRRLAYFSIVAVVLIAFSVYQCSSRPDDMRHMRHRPPMEMPDRQTPPDRREPPKGFEPPERTDSPFGDPPPSRPELRHKPRQVPPPIVGERDILAIVVLILMFGANLGIKGYFRSRDDRKRMAALEKQNLEQQLEYLRYQINPHFFMNTLNNIHALVDIDPAKAQETIVELSKMMRFVLYEGNKKTVPVGCELDFLRNYITLMQLRYTDKVRITLNLPSETPDKSIPPLILISFVENAFKHGVSYQHESFIEVSASVENDGLHFSCRNSKAEIPNQEKGGVGLNNVRKRLKLLYGSDYSLRIQDDAATYSVVLVIPYILPSSDNKAQL